MADPDVFVPRVRSPRAPAAAAPAPAQLDVFVPVRVFRCVYDCGGVLVVDTWTHRWDCPFWQNAGHDQTPF